MSDDPLERGLALRREVLGDEHVDRAIAATTAFTAPFQDYISRAAWGEVWARPGLDRLTRRLLTIALLTSLGAEHELELHLRAALDDGVGPDQIAEVLLHTAVYAGMPRANRGYAIAETVITGRQQQRRRR